MLCGDFLKHKQSLSDSDDLRNKLVFPNCGVPKHIILEINVEDFLVGLARNLIEP